jgi:ABC-2 type transport system ATP-binding protein
MRGGVDDDRVTRTGPDRLRIRGVTPDEVGRLAFTEQIPVLWLATEPSDLEQVFLALTTHHHDRRAAPATPAGP